MCNSTFVLVFDDVVCSVDNDDYTGWSREFGPGSYDCCNSFPNDQASSIIVHGAASAAPSGSGGGVPPSSIAEMAFSNVVPSLTGGNCQGEAPRVCGAVSQSTIGWGGEPDRAIDGNRDSNYGGGSCLHTDPPPDGESWFQVDLGVYSTVDRVAVYHRADCCQDRLESARIFVSDTPAYASGVICGNLNDHTQEPETSRCGGAADGRYVTVALTNGAGTDDAPPYMTICEIEIYATAGTGERPTGDRVDLTRSLQRGNCRGGTNPSGQPSGPDDGPRICGSVSQSTIGWGGEPDRAIDGDVATAWGSGSCSHTGDVDGPSWFQVDLGQTALVDEVQVWHRSDCCQDRLVSATLYVSETPDFSAGVRCGRLSDYTNEPESSQCGGSAQGRYVTTSLLNGGGNDGARPYMTICEMKIFGFPFSSNDAYRNLVPALQTTPCEDLTDGARRCGAVTQASIGWGGEPSRAVDGNRDTNYGGNSCSHTNAGGAW
eukprot:SAG31_NODE_1374_length_8594_cov_57.759623_3_plen_488_part_00